jgi:hypothetical protein
MNATPTRSSNTEPLAMSQTKTGQGKASAQDQTIKEKTNLLKPYFIIRLHTLFCDTTFVFE